MFESKAYLLLLADEHCRDMDKWLGIYTDVDCLAEGYNKARAYLDERFKDNEEKFLEVKIYEFLGNTYIHPTNYELAKCVDIDELLQAREKSSNSELLSRLAALSEAWKDLIEKTTGERPSVPLTWSVDDAGVLYLDDKWVCPVGYVDVSELEDRELSSLVSHVTIILPLAKGSMDLIITKELGAYEFSIIERMV